MRLPRNNSPVIAIAGDQAILNLELKKMHILSLLFYSK